MHASDFSPLLLDYSRLELFDLTARFAKKDSFLSVPTKAVGPVVSQYDEWRAQENYESWTFLDNMLALMTFEDRAFEHVTLIRQPIEDRIDYLGVVYFSDLKVLPIWFVRSPNFEAWIDGLTAKMTQTSPIVFQIRPNGMSISALETPDVLTQPVAFIQANAPRLYHKPQTQAAKQAYLDQFQLLASMQQTVDIAETQRLWKLFIDMTPNLSNAHLPNIEVPADAPDFGLFSAETGFEFPEELQVVYRLTNGSPDNFVGPKLMPFEKVIQAWKNWKVVFDDWTLEELTRNNQSDGEKTLGIYINPFWIPLIDDAAGNFIGMDLMPGPKGKVGQIIRFGADINLIRCEAESLNQFLFFEWDFYEAVQTAK